VHDRFVSVTGCTLVEGYGLTESSPVAACNPRHMGNKTGSIGLPLPSTEIAILHPETGQPVDTGEMGELCIKGPQVMSGYWNKPEETAATLKNGWLHTGDLGHMDADGYVFITDRLKDVIIINGYNVYPRQIEEFFTATLRWPKPL
jgi:Acyl-CoA synthetases (AMP-forming)/AMP-acid ligases II